MNFLLTSVPLGLSINDEVTVIDIGSSCNLNDPFQVKLTVISIN